MSDGELIVTAAIAPLNAEPRASSEQISQRLAGHRLILVQECGPWLRVRGSDGYEGWVHVGYVRRLDEGARRGRLSNVGGWQTGTGAEGDRVSLGCVVRDAGGHRRPLPLGAVLTDDVVIVEGIALPRLDLASRFPRAGAAIARTARECFEGTPYQWGGVTPWGADCSGLVQTCFALHGVDLPRDAWQQAECGRDVDPDPAAFQAADLLFFAERPDARVSHVGIALGPGEMVHLALGRGGFAIERLDRRDDPYVAALADRMRAARRLEL